MARGGDIASSDGDGVNPTFAPRQALSIDIRTGGVGCMYRSGCTVRGRASRWWAMCGTGERRSGPGSSATTITYMRIASPSPTRCWAPR